MIKKRLMELMADSRKHIGFQVAWQWLGLCLSIVLMMGIGRVIDLALDGKLTGTGMLISALGLFGGAFCKSACAGFAARESAKAGAEVKTRLRGLLFEKLASLGPSYHEEVPTAEAVQLSVEGIEQLETYFGRYLPQLFYSLLAPLTLFLALCRLSFFTSLVLFLCVPLIPVTIVIVQKIAKRLLNRYWSVYTGLGDSFLENLQGLTTLKIYQADGEKARQMDLESENFRRITMKVLMMQLNSIVVMDLVAYGGAALGMILAVSGYRNGNLSVGQAVSILLLASEFFIPMRQLGSFFHIAMNGMAASDRLFRILDLKSPDTGDAVLSGEAVSISLDHAGFSYNGEMSILKDITMEIPAHGLVSLCGVSGSGKSTIAGLLTGRKRGYQGSIRLCGEETVELSSVSAASLLRNVTLLSHDSVIFRGTVEENLKMAMPSAKKEDMTGALKEACLWEFLEKKEGLATMLTENGSNLSGGQRQRLALARALLHDSPVYIFDEAASNIDAESEEEIMRVIHRLAKTHAVLLISHRLANTAGSDQIYVLKDGMIRESGTFGELLEKQGIFAGLYREQESLEQYVKQGRRLVYAKVGD